MEGSLEKKTRHFPQRFHSRYFRLQKNVLNWYSSRQFTQPIGSLDLRDCISLLQKGLLIEIVTKRQRIILKAKNDKIRNAWLEQLEGWNHDGEVQTTGVPIPSTTCEAICACLEYVTRMGIDEHELEYYYSMLNGRHFLEAAPESVSDITFELLVNGRNFFQQLPSKPELLYPSNVLGAATTLLLSLPQPLLVDDIEKDFFSCAGFHMDLVLASLPSSNRAILLQLADFYMSIRKGPAGAEQLILQCLSPGICTPEYAKNIAARFQLIAKNKSKSSRASGESSFYSIPFQEGAFEPLPSMSIFSMEQKTMGSTSQLSHSGNMSRPQSSNVVCWAQQDHYIEPEKFKSKELSESPLRIGALVESSDQSETNIVFPVKKFGSGVSLADSEFSISSTMECGVGIEAGSVSTATSQSQGSDEEPEDLRSVIIRKVFAVEQVSKERENSSNECDSNADIGKQPNLDDNPVDDIPQNTLFSMTTQSEDLIDNSKHDYHPNPGLGQHMKKRRPKYVRTPYSRNRSRIWDQPDTKPFGDVHEVSGGKKKNDEIVNIDEGIETNDHPIKSRQEQNAMPTGQAEKSNFNEFASSVKTTMFAHPTANAAATPLHQQRRQKDSSNHGRLDWNDMSDIPLHWNSMSRQFSFVLQLSRDRECHRRSVRHLLAQNLSATAYHSLSLTFETAPGTLLFGQTSVRLTSPSKALQHSKDTLERMKAWRMYSSCYK